MTIVKSQVSNVSRIESQLYVTSPDSCRYQHLIKSCTNYSNVRCVSLALLLGAFNLLSSEDCGIIFIFPSGTASNTLILLVGCWEQVLLLHFKWNLPCLLLSKTISYACIRAQNAHKLWVSSHYYDFLQYSALDVTALHLWNPLHSTWWVRSWSQNCPLTKQ